MSLLSSIDRNFGLFTTIKLLEGLHNIYGTKNKVCSNLHSRLEAPGLTQRQRKISGSNSTWVIPLTQTHYELPWEEHIHSSLPNGFSTRVTFPYLLTCKTQTDQFSYFIFTEVVCRQDEDGWVTWYWTSAPTASSTHCYGKKWTARLSWEVRPQWL